MVTTGMGASFGFSEIGGVAVKGELPGTGMVAKDSIGMSGTIMRSWVTARAVASVP